MEKDIQSKLLQNLSKIMLGFFLIRIIQSTGLTDFSRVKYFLTPHNNYVNLVLAMGLFLVFGWVLWKSAQANKIREFRLILIPIIFYFISQAVVLILDPIFIYDESEMWAELTYIGITTLFLTGIPILSIWILFFVGIKKIITNDYPQSISQLIHRGAIFLVIAKSSVVLHSILSMIYFIDHSELIGGSLTMLSVLSQFIFDVLGYLLLYSGLKTIGNPSSDPKEEKSKNKKEILKIVAIAFLILIESAFIREFLDNWTNIVWVVGGGRIDECALSDVFELFLFVVYVLPGILSAYLLYIKHHKTLIVMFCLDLAIYICSLVLVNQFSPYYAANNVGSCNLWSWRHLNLIKSWTLGKLLFVGGGFGISWIIHKRYGKKHHSLKN